MIREAKCAHNAEIRNVRPQLRSSVGYSGAFLGSGIGVERFCPCLQGWEGSEGLTRGSSGSEPVLPTIRAAVACGGGRRRHHYVPKSKEPTEGLPVPAAADVRARQGCSGSGGLRIHSPTRATAGREGAGNPAGNRLPESPLSSLPQWPRYFQVSPTGVQPQC